MRKVRYFHLAQITFVKENTYQLLFLISTATLIQNVFYWLSLINFPKISMMKNNKWDEILDTIANIKKEQLPSFTLNNLVFIAKLIHDQHPSLQVEIDLFVGFGATATQQ